MASLAMVSFTSCSSDDDGDDNSNGNLPELETAADAALYEVTTANSDIASIELTEAGNYIVTYNANNAPSAVQGKQAQAEALKNKGSKMFRALSGALGNMAAQTRTYTVYSGIAYGTYTKNADGTYALDGFGTVKITADASGNVYSMEITRADGTTNQLEAKMQEPYTESAMTKSICRTWGFSKVRVYMKYNGRTYMDLNASSLKEMAEKMRDWAKANDEEYGPEDEESYNELILLYSQIEPTDVIFSRAGTYMVKYSNNTLGIAKWYWTNESKGELRYSWSGEEGPDAFASGEATLSFSGSNLVVKEVDVDSEDGETMEMGSELTFVAK